MRMSFRLNSTIITLSGLALTACSADQPWLHAPSVDTYAKHDPDGVTILSNGRYLKPVGRHLPVAHFPYGLALSRDGGTLFVASDETGQIITGWREGKPVIAVVTPPTYKRNGKKERPTNAGG